MHAPSFPFENNFANLKTHPGAVEQLIANKSICAAGQNYIQSLQFQIALDSYDLTETV